MGSLFRSEEMALCQLFLPSEAAYACVSELGELGLVQFRDLNPDVNTFQRKFVNEVRRCDEMERQLFYLEREIKKCEISILDTGNYPEAPQPRQIIDLETAIEKLENDFGEDSQNAKALKCTFLELTELKHILQKTQVFFDEEENSYTNSTESMTGALINEANTAPQSTQEPVKLGFVAGVIARERLAAFERMLWRACYGKAFLRQTEIGAPLEDPLTGNQVQKSAFIIFFQGDKLKTRVRQICDGFRATLYPCPESSLDRQEMVKNVRTQMEDLKIVLGKTQEHRQRVLMAASKNLRNWFIKVRKIKAIYHTLNMFNIDVTRKFLIAEIWVPVLDIATIQLALQRGTERTGSSVPSILNLMVPPGDPPTYNRTNKYTSGFQALIDAYGVASYREINPAPYTIITFPFLFAVMFGDTGHGLIMFLFAGFMIWKEKSLGAKKLDEICKIFFSGRYIILLMGLFSMYTGLIYNDVFSKSLNIFGSAWSAGAYRSYNMSRFEVEKIIQLNPSSIDLQDGYRYPLGMDPVWQLAKNKINFLNSYKMKISIIFGVTHMLSGVLVGLWNNLYFKKRLNIICEFIPQVIFLTFLFIYMAVLMFIKWVKYSALGDTDHSPYCAPSVLITFINMMLFKESIPPAGCSTASMFPGQNYLEKCFVILALLCIPWMMFAKPLLMMREKKRQKDQPDNQVIEHDKVEGAIEDQPPNDQIDSVHEDEEENMGEVFINQAIHTIEYVLGSVSHTASYLRLWALSLAHAQLSEVLWNRVLHYGMKVPIPFGGIWLSFIFAVWAVLTVSILVLMEGLSAFLHTLRLHWVEFQSKFYAGTGYAFEPFSFKIILDAIEERD